MKRLTILVCILTMLLALAGVASASPAQPQKFRIKGYTTSVDLSGYPSLVGLKAEGKVIQHIQGTFTMDEDIVFGLTSITNTGVLTITTKKGDEVFIQFAGDTDGTTFVRGDFSVVRGTGAYVGLTGGGTYEGIPDRCEFGYTPPYFTNCPGFWVDFTFDGQ
jgi:hypothetical protein